MKAVVFDSFGNEDVLYVGNRPMPELRPYDIIVRVGAAGVNRADLLQREGFYAGQSFGESDILGLEVAGEVVTVGADVSDVRPGERMMGIVGGGAYAEFARIDRGMSVRIPTGVSDIEAAAFMESFVVAWEAISHLANVGAGDRVVVHAGSGGVGSACVQVAAALDAVVYATAPSSRLDQVRELGAAAVYDYRESDFEVGVRKQTGGKGVNAVIDFIGGDYLARNLRLLVPGGCLVQIGIMTGQADSSIPLNLLLHNHLRLIGTVLKSRSQAEKRAIVRRFADHVLPLLAQQRLRPVIAKVFPMSDVAEAHRLMKRGGNFGKIVLSMD